MEESTKDISTLMIKNFYHSETLAMKANQQQCIDTR